MGTETLPEDGALLAAERAGTYLADTGFAAAAGERHWRAAYGAAGLATPQALVARAWPAAAGRWAAGKRQVVEQVFGPLKDFFALERHRAKTLPGRLARVAAKLAAFTAAQWLNARHARPLRHLADLLI